MNTQFHFWMAITYKKESISRRLSTNNRRAFMGSKVGEAPIRCFPTDQRSVFRRCCLFQARETEFFMLLVLCLIRLSN
jgi:hypothetical protein